MGERQVSGIDDEGDRLRLFTRRLLQDLRALERMIAEGRFETGVRRIGAEQEVFLVDADWRPAMCAMEILDVLRDPHFTTEVGLYNLEMNLDPVVFGGDCLRRMETQLVDLLERTRAAARTVGGDVVLVGILPTTRKSDLGIESMTPIPRYHALNQAMTRMRGRDYEIHIKGVDEVLLRHDSVMVESCNASFQLHFQVEPAEFARFYNIAQVAAAPLLAAATNSPLLFGRRLWRETRIALFQQSVDTRSSGLQTRQQSPRVDFGRAWVRESVTEIYREDITRHRVLIASEPEDDPLQVLDRGGVPELKALRLHNGTVYRWNRACYGIHDGKPHLRIENRVLPSGPTPLDEVANAALWYGLMSALVAEHQDITKHITFDDAKQNFIAAARLGLGAEISWLGGRALPAQALLKDHLIPMAKAGLTLGKVDSGDAERYLGVIEERVGTTRTGSSWILRSLADMRDQGSEGERLNALTAGLVARQWDGTPVHRWAPATLAEGGGWKHNYVKVEQLMSTDVVTVRETDAIDLVASLMLWERIRHVPVEDDTGRLVGVVSYRALLRTLAGETRPAVPGQPLAVSDVMRRSPVTVEPETPTLEAISIMRRHGYGSLPVVKEGHLLGILSARSLLPVAGEFLEEKTEQGRASR